MYFDYLATTPLDARVRADMDEYWDRQFGNPHSSDHAYGFEAGRAVESASLQLNALLPLAAQGGRWIFTSGASEANNLALKGVAEQAWLDGNPRNRILVSAIEHACVIETARYLEKRGFIVEFLPVDNYGALDLNEFSRRIGPDVLLVSVMWANNETGVIQPVGEIARLAKAHGALFHSDAAQAAGKIALDTNGPFPDLLSVSAHKIYGPKGAGALYVGADVTLAAQIHGGGQQWGLRAGTVPVPLVMGLASAARHAIAGRDAEAARLGAMRDGFEEIMGAAFSDFRINGKGAPRLAHVSNFQIPGCDMGELLSALPEIAVSRGSACGSAGDKVSHVLAAMRMEFFAHECLRVSFGRMSEDGDEIILAETLIEVAQALRSAQKKWA